MALTYTHGREFVRQVCPIIERRDIEALVCHLRCHWPNKDLRGLLGCGHDEAVKAALLCLSMVGDSGQTGTVNGASMVTMDWPSNSKEGRLASLS